METVSIINGGMGCLGGTLLRIGTKTVAGTSAMNPSGSDLPISIKGAIPPSGGTRHDQVSCRTAANFCTPETTNRTSGVTIVSAP